MSLFGLKVEDLIGKGYFPRELPPPFSTELLRVDILRNILRYRSVFSNCKPKHIIKHSIPRIGNVRRGVSIPNPVPFFNLCDSIVQNQADIDKCIKPSPYSITKPVVDSTGQRAVVAENWFNDIPLLRAEKRANAKYLLKADVSKFYSSIYTHSIPWALHGKQYAKKNRSNALCGNAIDKFLRDCQDGQTIGIPIGPDTSLIIAELILSQVDEEFAVKTGFDAFRFVDDYEIYCKDRSDIELSLCVLESALLDYELCLNPLKISIVELPDSFESTWVSELRTMTIADHNHKSQYYDLLKFFDRVIYYKNSMNDSHVISYAIGRLTRIDIDDDNKDFVFNFLLQCYMSEPIHIKVMLSMFCDRFSEERGALDTDKKAKLQIAVVDVVRNALKYGHHNEIAWGLWVFIVFSLKIPDDIFDAVLSSGDGISILLALNANARSLVDGAHYINDLCSQIHSDSLQEDNWLMVYEACQQGWLSPRDRSYIDSSSEFLLLESNHISFYDSEKQPIDLVYSLPPVAGLQFGILGFGGGGY